MASDLPIQIFQFAVMTDGKENNFILTKLCLKFEFPFFFDVENNVIYGLCERNMLLQFSKFQFLYVMFVIHFSEGRHVGI